MAINLKTSIASRNTQLNALAALANNGYIRLYDGMQPATPESQISTQTLLAELRFSDPAFSEADLGVITANEISDDEDIAASGSASWFRVLKSDGTTALWDGSVGTQRADMILATTELVRHAILQITSLTYTLPQ
jgi:hypothetical protein